MFASRKSNKAKVRRPSRYIRNSTLLGLAALIAIAAPIAAVWAPMRQAQDAAAEADRLADGTQILVDLRVEQNEFRHGIDRSLDLLARGETATAIDTGSRMYEMSEQMGDHWIESYVLAVEWGDQELADRIEAGGDESMATASSYLPAFSDPGLDTSESRSRAWQAMLTAEANTEELLALGERHAGDAARRLEEGLSTLRQRLVAVAVAGVMILVGLGLTLGRRFIADHRTHLDAQAGREEEAARTNFEMQLRSGLDMASTEEEAHRTVARGLAEIEPAVRAEVILADSSRTHFEVVAVHEAGGSDGCTVAVPNDCPAVRHGHPLTFESSEVLDACPNLRGRSQGPVGGLCIPMSIGSQTAGVLHIATPHLDLPPEATIALYETAARVSSDRLGMLRAMARSEAQAATDPLTGLLNRRSLDDKVQVLVRQGAPFTVAFGDLDHFKRLNDLHGHETGDRALRLFSRIATSETRPTDLIARYGGEEFVLVFPHCGISEATELLERIRIHLAEQIPSANLPTLTVSFGLCEWDQVADVRDVIERADQALLAAKAEGRDRIVVAERLHPPDRGDLLSAAVPLGGGDDVPHQGWGGTVSHDN